ncbi:MAG: uracil-DNA glycosylase [Candidatus Aquicultorales bacterium]
MSRIKRRVEEDEQCRLEADSRIVFGGGNPGSGIVLVGEGPGAEEESKRRPFVGAAGRLLRNALAARGFDPERDFYFLNIVYFRSFRLTPERRKENRPPGRGQIEACRPYVEEQIDAIAPKLIVTLGAHAARWFLGKEFNLSKEHGVMRDWRGKKVFPTYHPGAALRPFGPEGAERKRNFYEDLDRLAERIDESREEYRLSA